MSVLDIYGASNTLIQLTNPSTGRHKGLNARTLQRNHRAKFEEGLAHDTGPASLTRCCIDDLIERLFGCVTKADLEKKEFDLNSLPGHVRELITKEAFRLP